MKRIPMIIVVLALVLPIRVHALECTDCHGEVNIDKYKQSIHGRNEMTCADCHGYFQVTADGHGKPGPVDCSMCHEDSGTAVNGSIHASHGTFNAVSCFECHGNHYILSDIPKIGREYRIMMNEMCSRCHILSETHPFSKTQRQFVKSYFTSVHSTTIQKSGLIFSATCVDCHGSHNVYPEEEDKSLMHRQKIHDTCGTCHQGAASDFMAGIHGEALKNGNPDAPTCIDCHEKHYIQHAHMKSSQIYPVNIPKTCLKCHGKTELIDKYNWSPLTEENYGDSYHGAALKLGDISVAHCASCHMAHKILSHTNPQSPTHWDNLSETCGVCHTSDDPVNIDNLGKIHVLTAKELHPISKLIANLYRILIVATLGFFIAFISSDLYRNILNRRNKKG